MDVRSLLRDAPQFDVHKQSEHKEVISAVSAIFDEIKILRKSRKKQIRGEYKVKQSLMAVIIDLWVAYKLSLNPYRAISKNKTDYQTGSRYRKIFLKYDYLIPVINDLCDLGYVKQKLGYTFPNHKRRTRIRAKTKLINKILSPEYGVKGIVEKSGAISIVDSSEKLETIIFKDSYKKLIEYDDDENTNQMRQNLKHINETIKKTRITLDITDKQYEALLARLNSDKKYREPIDFTRVELHRVFNNSTWENGGRFYGAWWQNIPREYRKYIDINHKPTVEVDYSGHHIRILYANAGIEPPQDPYDLNINIFDRELQKKAMLILINTDSLDSAIKAIRNDLEIKFPQGILNALAARHRAISMHFYSGSGVRLMYEDSQIAERVILMMMDRGATVLPVHDSFIVRNSYENELLEVMEIVFTERYGKSASLKIKTTSLEERQKEARPEVLNNPITDSLEVLINERLNNYKWYINTWGF